MSEKKINRRLAIFLGIICALYAIFFLVYMWLDVVNEIIFFKISITFGVFAALPLTCYLLWNEFIIDRKMRDDKYTN